MSDKPDIGKDRLGPYGDEFYAALIAAHEGLSFEESAALNARLVLVLANLVGDTKRLNKALETARKGAS
jgi:hypothetical protein